MACAALVVASLLVIGENLAELLARLAFNALAQKS
jgi:hypothetical protein